MEDFIRLFLNVEVMMRTWPLLKQGLWMTAQLCAVVIGLGLVGGLFLSFLAMAKSRWLRWPAFVVIDVLRAVPPLVLLIFIYSGLPFAGLDISPFAAVAVAFFLNNSAYYAEIYRAGIQSIPAGQTEAARATGLTSAQAMAYVVLPQAVRNVLPDLLSNTVEVVKLTSLASVVSLAELLYSANMARSLTYNSSPLVMAALIYLAFLWPLVRLVSRYQRKLAV
jgi:polar amino acid transport system permease protein